MQTIGFILTSLREQRNKSVVDVARETRIPLWILQNLEEDKLEDLPATVYLKGFIQSYCRCLAFDPSEALRVFEQQLYRAEQTMEVSKEDVSLLTYQNVGPTAEGRAGLSLVHAVVLVVAALTFLVALFGTDSGSDSKSVAEQTTIESGEGDSLSTVSPEQTR